MTDIDNLIERLRTIGRWVESCGYPNTMFEAADALDAYRKATGGLPPDMTDRHVLSGDLDALEYAIADYIAKWGEHWTGRPYIGEFGVNIAGLPVAMANMAMTVIRKNIVPAATFEEPT